MKNEYVKEDKISGKRRSITKEEALKLVGSDYEYPKEMLENSTRFNPINLSFSLVWKENK